MSGDGSCPMNLPCCNRSSLEIMIQKKWTSLVGLSIHIRNCEGAKRPGKRSRRKIMPKMRILIHIRNRCSKIPSSNRRELVEAKNSYSMSVTYKQEEGKGQQGVDVSSLDHNCSLDTL